MLKLLCVRVESYPSYYELTLFKRASAVYVPLQAFSGNIAIPTKYWSYSPWYRIPWVFRPFCALILGAMLRLMPLLRAGTSADAGASSSSVLWTQLQPGLLRRDRNVVRFDDVRIARRRCSLACRVEGSIAPGTALFGLLDDTEAITRWSGDPVAPDHLAATNDSVDVCTDGQASFLTLSVGPKTARQIGVRPSSLIRNRGGVAKLRRYLHALFENNAAGERTDAQRATSDDVLELLSAALEKGADTVVMSQTRNRRLAAVRACQQYMLEHLERSVTLLDLADVSGLGVRSLFNAFEAVTGLSPMAYLRAQRLNRVRDVLLDPTRRSTRIIDVAGEWGFWHMGHFTSAYAAMFGETPSRTVIRTLPK